LHKLEDDVTAIGPEADKTGPPEVVVTVVVTVPIVTPETEYWL